MKLAVLLLALTLTGCAGATAYLQQHLATIAVIGASAGAIASVESAAINTVTLVKDAEKK